MTPRPARWGRADEFLPERFEDSRVELKGTNFEFILFGSGMAFGLAPHIGARGGGVAVSFGLEVGIAAEDLDRVTSC